MENTLVRNINMNHLYYFHMIAVSGSLTKGAKRLNITQPTLSQQIIKLESSLNTTLFRREGRGLTLTENGEFLLNYTKKIFDLTENMMSSFNYQKYRTILKMYNVGISTSTPRILSTHILQPLFQEKEFGLKIEEQATRNLFESLKKNQLDFFIAELPNDTNSLPEDICYDVIIEPQYCVMIGPKGNLENFKNKGIESLTNISYFKYPSKNELQRKVDRLFLRENVTPNVVGESEDIHTVAAFTRLNTCFSIMPDVAASNFQNLKKVFPIKIESQKICAFYLDQRDNSEIQNLVKLLS